MPHRNQPLVTNETYHVFNRSVGRLPIFLTQKDYKRAMEVISFYIYSKPPIRFSHYNRLPKDSKKDFLENLEKNCKKQIEILAFCLMPNHFHFLLKQIEPNGISNFIRNFQNSYAKYFNTKTQRSGALFQSMFKAVRMESDEQFLHVARYIHLNPATSYLIQNVSELEKYNWSSYPLYLDSQNSEIINKEAVLNFFPSLQKFKEFTLDQADFQRQLDYIKHLTFE